MKIVDVTAETLETIWTLEEKGSCTVENVLKEHAAAIGYIVDDEILSELEKSGLVKISGTDIALTAEGKVQAEPIIRRHRLAERLLVDVLGMTFGEMEESACEFEHTLAPGLTEAICTLLGHPRECPHGFLEVGDEVRISFIRKADPVLIGKLVSFGVSPGKKIKIRQKFPAYVIQIDNTQIALEQDIAMGIYGLKI
jgi:DtxR family Mn-dependent transcriptional regulator